MRGIKRRQWQFSSTKHTGLKWTDFYQPSTLPDILAAGEKPSLWLLRPCFPAAGSLNWTDCSELKEGKDTNTAQAFAKCKRKWANKMNTPNCNGYGGGTRSGDIFWNLGILPAAIRWCKAHQLPGCDSRLVALTWRSVKGARGQASQPKAFWEAFSKHHRSEPVP